MVSRLDAVLVYIVQALSCIGKRGSWSNNTIKHENYLI